MTGMEVQEGPDMWSWLTSHRAVSNFQKYSETNKERPQIKPKIKGKDQKPSESFSKEDLSGIDKNESYHNQERTDHSMKTEKNTTNNDRIQVKGDGSFRLTSRDVKALTIITVLAIGFRFWKISLPDEITLNEAKLGRLVNRYLNKEYVFDNQPPLASIIMTKIASLSNYKGTFNFDIIGDHYPSDVPYLPMRFAMAIMGVLCAPMAYITLKLSGQGALASILASTMVIFENAMATDSRQLSQDTPLVFFTASTFMFWTLSRNSSASPFSLAWYLWLLGVGVSMTGAMATKLIGIASVGMVGFLMASSVVNLAMDRNIKASTWSKHFLARMVALVLVPTILYKQIFQYHFDHERFLPRNPSLPRANYDLQLLSKPYRQTLLPRTQKRQTVSEINWRDVAFGSVVQIQNEKTGSYIHSMDQRTPGKSKQQQLGGYEHSDLNTHWIVIRADMEEGDNEEIPPRLQFLRDGDILRFRHVPTRLCLHSHSTKSYSSKENIRLYEVTAYGAHGHDGDENDWWIVEAVDPVKNKDLPIEGDGDIIKAMSTAFRLRHFKLGCYLIDTSSRLPFSWGKGRNEIACRSKSKVRSPTIWRFSMNRHQYLPHDVPVASYQRLTFWQKFSEFHRLLWNGKLEHVEQQSAVHPIFWPLGQKMVHSWTGYTRQIFMIANPAIWGISIMGVLVCLGLRLIFTLREKRGYVESKLVADFKEFHLNASNVFLVGWAAHYIPFLVSQKRLEMSNYFPALYFSILATSSIIGGASSFIPRRTRFSLFIGLICAIIGVFSMISPLTNGTTMTNEQCLSLSQWVNPLERVSQSVAINLHCELFPLANSRRLLFPELKKKRELRLSLNKVNWASQTTTAKLPRETSSKNGTSSQNDNINDDNNRKGKDNNFDGDLLLSGQQPKLVFPESKKKSAPVLPLIFPPEDRQLPMDHVVMIGHQVPPQLRKPQKG